MQPDSEAAKQSTWGRRLIFSGLAALLVASIILYSQSDEFESGSNPSKNNVGSAEGNHQVDLTLKDDCYIAYSLSGDDNGEAILEDSAGNEVAEKYCGGDYEPFSKEGLTYTRMGTWNLMEGGNYSLTYSCENTAGDEEGCEDDVVWLISYEESLSEIISVGVIAAFGVCLIGIVLIPLGTVLLTMRPRKPKQTFVVVETDAEGQALVNVDGGPKYVTLQPGMQDGGVGGDALRQDSSVPDAANLLTTDQVYTLVHGDSEEKAEVLNEANEKSSSALMEQLGENDMFRFEGDGPSTSGTKPNIPDPFLDSQVGGMVYNKPPPPKAKRSVTPDDEAKEDAWKAWDEG